jgi:hypothetical protein
MEKADVLSAAASGAGQGLPPLAVTVSQACHLSGFGPTSIWAFLKDGRLKAVRVPGVRRTLVSYASLLGLLAPASEPRPRRRGRPRKPPASGVQS